MQTHREETRKVTVTVVFDAEEGKVIEVRVFSDAVTATGAMIAEYWTDGMIFDAEREERDPVRTLDQLNEILEPWEVQLYETEMDEHGNWEVNMKETTNG